MNTQRIDACVDNICYFVKTYKSRNIKPIDIYNSSNYEELHQDISIEMILNKIKRDETIIEDWILFTQDKRWVPAWGLFKNKDGKWSVSLIQKDGKSFYELVYEDKILACAHMIKFEMEGLRLRKKQLLIKGDR